MRPLTLCALLATSACASTTVTTSSTGDTPLAKVPGEPSLPPVPPAKVTYYKQAFPGGARFVPRAIPSHLLRSADVGNDTYVEVYALDGTRLGWLRDFVGPVSTSGECACDPLNVTLVFGPSGAFLDLISPAPLTKYGHEPYSAEDRARLIVLLKDPPRELMAARGVHDVVDATTGATKPEYKDFVVNRAALETRRLAGLVTDTRSILKEAPVTWDRHRLEPVLKLADRAARARALAQALPEVTSDEAVDGAYRVMADDYVEAQARGAAPDAEVEARLLDAKIVERVRPEAALAACHALADRALRLDFVDRCAKDLSRHSASNPLLARLVGTSRFGRGDWAAALASFDSAVLRVSLEQDPVMYGRYAIALAKLGRAADACERSLDLYRAHPLLPQLTELAAPCRKANPRYDANLEELDRERRGSVLASERSDGKKAPPVDLDDPNFQPVTLQPFEKGKATVLVFFATWCPHCQDELPKLNDFAARAQRDVKLKGKVNLVAVRTAIERETEPYEAFLARFKPAFPVFTDPAMSIALTRFAQVFGVPAGLPTVVVIDGTGAVRFFMEHGRYRDTARELEWAVAETLD